MSQKPLAVVTGASSGIGYALAKELASQGYDLFITSASERLEGVRPDLAAWGHMVAAQEADLTNPDGVDELYAGIQGLGRPVDLLCLNAGVGVGGDFATTTDLHAELKLIDLNVRSTVYLCKLVARDMVSHGSGQILITSSLASTMPAPFEAVYGASKAFVQSFALSLREELKDRGVEVTAFMPGATETEFFHRAGMDNTNIGQSKKDDPADVAKQAIAALKAGKSHMVTGSLKTKAMGAMANVLPEETKGKMHRHLSEPKDSEAAS